MFDVREQPSIGPFWMGMTYRSLAGTSRKQRWWRKLKQWARLKWLVVMKKFARLSKEKR
jgi:hypothetical protein